MVQEAVYRRHKGPHVWRCTVHQREATHVIVWPSGAEEPHCDPALSGVLLPCRCVIDSPKAA